MEKLKTNFLKTMKVILDVVTVTALILTVLSGSLAIFYDEIQEVFVTFGWNQERLTYAAVALGGLGSAGVIAGRVSSGMKAAIMTSTLNYEKGQKEIEQIFTTKVDGIEKYYDAKIAKIEQSKLESDALLADKLKDYEDKLREQELFNIAQAKKYINAPDNLVDAETKQAYREYLEATNNKEK